MQAQSLSHLDDLTVHTEFRGGSGDLLPTHGPQAGHAVVPVTLQTMQVLIAKLSPVLQLYRDQSQGQGFSQNGFYIVPFTTYKGSSVRKS